MANNIRKLPDRDNRTNYGVLEWLSSFATLHLRIHAIWRMFVQG